ncbi:MAG: allantoicase [Alphaproteobacteria bacterium]
MSAPQETAEFATKWLNLAQPRLGAKAIYSTDDFFAPMERMLNPAPAVFIAGKYDDHGKWMDGWESRRKRIEGHDYCVVRLGLPGIIKGVDIDTSHFTGNYPPQASIEACSCEDDPGADARWTEIVPRLDLGPDAHHFVAVASAEAWTHVRLHIYPDGGVARLRVYGKVHADWQRHDPGGLIDLAALRLGGRFIDCNDQHFGSPENLLAPGRGVDMGDGWETRRRREPGNDWAIIALGHRGEIRRITVDTAHFKGNYPDRCSIEGVDLGSVENADGLGGSVEWRDLLPEQKLQMDREHFFNDEIAGIGPITHIRFNIFPDGGVSRLRLFGTIVP